jgi:hypothetical protein
MEILIVVPSIFVYCGARKPTIAQGCLYYTHQITPTCATPSGWQLAAETCRGNLMSIIKTPLSNCWFSCTGILEILETMLKWYEHVVCMGDKRRANDLVIGTKTTMRTTQSK